MAYQIGEFSRITQLSVKTLRYYHEEGLLLPARVDDMTGYRFYDQSNLERASLIRQLREFSFSIEEIKEILETCKQDREVLKHIKAKAAEIKQRIATDQDIEKKLQACLEWKPKPLPEGLKSQVVIKEVADLPVMSLRFRGQYPEVGKAISTLFRVAGRQAAGGPFSLYYDQEYKEEADIEVCVPVRQEVRHPAAHYRVLDGGRVVSLVHKGPYDDLGRSYQQLFDYLQAHKVQTQLPIREHYLKGPGLFFRGNPRNYLTEIQYLMGT